MKTILLKDNNEIIRQQIRRSGIDLCLCASFSDSCWLDYHPGITDTVHGVGVPYEGMTREDSIALYIHEEKKLIICRNVDEFILKIKEAQK